LTIILLFVLYVCYENSNLLLQLLLFFGFCRVVVCELKNLVTSIRSLAGFLFVILSIMKINIVGKGYYGIFLTDLFKDYVELSEDAETVVLAVPFSAYEDVAKKYAGKHLVNVCSVQEKSNEICKRYSDSVTGFHPLFGPKSSEDNRRGILTLECDESFDLLSLFQKIGTKVIHTIDDRKIDGEFHDKIMAQTHALVISLNRLIVDKIKPADWVPDEILTPSFIALREFARQYEDMSEGTVSSILANPYISDN